MSDVSLEFDKSDTEIDILMQNFMNISTNENDLNISTSDNIYAEKESVRYNNTGGTIDLPINTDVKAFKNDYRTPALNCHSKNILNVKNKKSLKYNETKRNKIKISQSSENIVI